MEEKSEMLEFVKALADPNRLKIVGVLVREPGCLADIAARSSLPIRQVFNHLVYLEKVGLVHKKVDRYVLDTYGLERLARSQLEGKSPGYIPKPGLDKNKKKILATFLNADGTIRQVPNSRTQVAKFRFILEYILAAFEPGIVYTEKEVNHIVRQFNEDVSGLRRDLIDFGLLARERDGSKYWRCPESPVSATTEGSLDGHVTVSAE
jgi:ArsR family transcriptional regulator